MKEAYQADDKKISEKINKQQNDIADRLIRANDSNTKLDHSINNLGKLVDEVDKKLIVLEDKFYK